MSSAIDRVAIARSASATVAIRYCASAQHILRYAHVDVHGIVVDVNHESVRELQAIADFASTALIPSLLLIRPTTIAVRHLGEYAERFPDCRLVVHGADLSRHVEDLANRVPNDSAALEILTRLSDSLADAALAIVGAAAIIGHRDVAVVELANACGMSQRTLEKRLAAVSAMSAKKLLMWMLALHAVWRASYLQWSPKRIAHAAGVSSERALSTRVERVTGRRLTELRRAGELVLLYERFLYELDGTSSMPTGEAPVSATTVTTGRVS